MGSISASDESKVKVIVPEAENAVIGGDTENKENFVANAKKTCASRWIKLIFMASLLN